MSEKRPTQEELEAEILEAVIYNKQFIDQLIASGITGIPTFLEDELRLTPLLMDVIIRTLRLVYCRGFLYGILDVIDTCQDRLSNPNSKQTFSNYFEKKDKFSLIDRARHIEIIREIVNLDVPDVLKFILLDLVEIRVSGVDFFSPFVSSQTPNSDLINDLIDKNLEFHFRVGYHWGVVEGLTDKNLDLRHLVRLVNEIFIKYHIL